MTPLKLAVSATALVAASATTAAARDQIQIAGSSTVLPYATIVAEAFAENMGFTAPVVEGGGSGAGLKQFCAGVGENTIDIANSSRPIREAELAECQANGVGNVMEVRFGYDGIVFASSAARADFALTPEFVFKAIAVRAVELMTGARALRSIMENLMLEIMYELPQRDDVVEVVIDAGVVSGKRRPTLRKAGKGENTQDAA